MRIKIESGVSRVMGQESSWLYVYTDVHGVHKIVFLVPEGQRAEIGDFIENGVLLKREGLQINPDVSKWQKPRRKVWGE